MNLTLVIALALGSCLVSGQARPRVIEIIADQDSRYKVEGQSKPVLTLKAGENVVLRITAHRAKTWNRDGSVHGFAMLRRDGSEVLGWNLLLKEGINEFHVTAPKEAGDYVVVCTVVCSHTHEGMNMKVVINP